MNLSSYVFCKIFADPSCCISKALGNDSNCNANITVAEGTTEVIRCTSIHSPLTEDPYVSIHLDDPNVQLNAMNNRSWEDCSKRAEEDITVTIPASVNNRNIEIMCNVTHGNITVAECKANLRKC